MLDRRADPTMLGVSIFGAVALFTCWGQIQTAIQLRNGVETGIIVENFNKTVSYEYDTSRRSSSMLRDELTKKRVETVHLNYYFETATHQKIRGSFAVTQADAAGLAARRVIYDPTHPNTYRFTDTDDGILGYVGVGFGILCLAAGGFYFYKTRLGSQDGDGDKMEEEATPPT